LSIPWESVCVPDPILIPRSGLEALAAPGWIGKRTETPGITVALRSAYALSSVMARPGCVGALSERVRDAFGLKLPAGPHRSAAGTLAFVSAGPDHWLAVATDLVPRSFEARLRNELAGFASVSDQSDGRLILAIGGPKAREVLAKGIPIDLHPRMFDTRHAAATVAHQVQIHLWQTDEVPTYEIAVFRSYAASFWQWIIEAGSEFGVLVA
jgi:sarcosine oxidase subunit gamma